MINVAVRLFCETPKGYDSGARGEARYTLNALEAMALHPDIEPTSHRPWKNTEVSLDGVVYGIDPNKLYHIFLSYENPGVPQPIPPRVKLSVLTYWERPSKFNPPSMNWVATHPYPSGIRHGGLQKHFGNRMRDLPFPAAKEFLPPMGFDRKKIVWTSRDGQSGRQDLKGPIATEILKMMRTDKDLMLTVLTGYEKQHYPKVPEQIRNHSFGAFPADRIEILPRCSRDEFMNHVRSSKLSIILPVLGAFGGSPLESLAAGVPILSPKGGPLDNCPAYPTYRSGSEAVQLMKRLFSNEKFYKDTTCTGQKYVQTFHSYDVFCQKLLALIGRK